MTDNRPPNLGDGSEDITGIPQCSAEADVEFTRDYEVGGVSFFSVHDPMEKKTNLHLLSR